MEPTSKTEYTLHGRDRIRLPRSLFSTFLASIPLYSSAPLSSTLERGFLSSLPLSAQLPEEARVSESFRRLSLPILLLGSKSECSRC